MGWTRSSDRFARDRRRPCLERLESRQLLSTIDPMPAASTLTNPDGTINHDRIIGASATRSAYQVDGSGMRVAVIDTGVNYNNAALGGGIGAGHKVVAGVDFTGSPNGVLPTWQHGTGVAGLLAGNSPDYQGVAPGVDIVALRVFGDGNQGSFENIERALDWVVQHHSEYNISAVNLSISDGGNYQSNLFAQDGSVGQAMTATIAQLDSMNIPVVVAAGNSFNGKTQGQGFPAVIPDTISVTATDVSDKLASNAQRLGAAKGGASATTLAAPGVGVKAPADGNSFMSEDGTSFATPQVTGAVVLLQQIYEKAYHTRPSVAQLTQLLQQGADTIHDAATNIDIGRLDILGSAKILGQQIAASQAKPPASTGGGTPATIPVDVVSNVGSGAATTPPVVVAPPPVVVTPPPVVVVTPPPVVMTPPVVTPPPVVVTPPIQSAPAPAPVPPTSSAAAVPQTEVFYNGVSIGNFATAQLSTRYANLFAFLKGQTGSIRIYGPKNATPNLGASKPSGSTDLLHPQRTKVGGSHPNFKVHEMIVNGARKTPKVGHPKIVSGPISPSFRSKV